MTPDALIPRRTLGRTGISVSELALGCGPIANLMTGDDREKQVAVLARAVGRGLNWIDTAATYGKGQSEKSVGAALRQVASPEAVHIATKVRLTPQYLRAAGSIESAVRESVAGSLERLGVARVTLLQLHNAITERRGDEETSITVRDVLGRGGVLESFGRLQDEGIVRHLGITAVGQTAPLAQVVASGGFDTIQVPYNLVNPSAGTDVTADFPEANYGNVIAHAREQSMGVFAIRVFAAGALLGQEPTPYTEVSKFFTLDLYRRDQRLADELRGAIGDELSLKEAALRFTLSHPGINAAIIGFSAPSHVDEAIEIAARGPLPPELLRTIRRVRSNREGQPG